ncbi:MAG: hypothetical protein QW478_12550, partial [Candidatus Micrarchaeaceae archaeon]
MHNKRNEGCSINGNKMTCTIGSFMKSMGIEKFNPIDNPELDERITDFAVDYCENSNIPKEEIDKCVE